MALKDKKVNTAVNLDKGLAQALRGRLHDGKLACAAAFDLAEERGIPRLDVGQAADVLQLHLTHCQLGLFGYPDKAKFWETTEVAGPTLPPGLDDAILATRDKSNVISCAALMAIAERFGLPKVQAGYEADRLGVRIKHCQLGAF